MSNINRRLAALEVSLGKAAAPLVSPYQAARAAAWFDEQLQKRLMRFAADPDALPDCLMDRLPWHLAHERTDEALEALASMVRLCKPQLPQSEPRHRP